VPTAAVVVTGIPYWTFPSFAIGPLTVRSFGLFVALGVILGVYVAARRNERFGIPRSQTEKVAMILVVIGFIGARLLFVFTHLQQFTNPLQAFAVWDGGLQFSGGIIAALIAAPFVLRKWPRRRALDLLDGAALGFAVGQFVGRFGCYSVGEHLGGPTDFFLGVTYRGGTVLEGPLTVGVTYHNAALYEIFWLIPIIVILFIQDRRHVRAGVMSATFAIMYGAFRFGTDFVRINDKTVFGLTGAQYMCLALLLVGIWLMWYRLRRKPTADAATQAQETSVKEASVTEPSVEEPSGEEPPVEDTPAPSA